MRASWATGAIRVRGDTLAGVPHMVLSSQRRPTMGFTPNIRVALHLSYFQALVAPTAHGQGTLELQRFRVKAPCGPGSGWWVSGKQTLTVQRVLCSFHNLPLGQCLWLFNQLSRRRSGQARLTCPSCSCGQAQSRCFPESSCGSRSPGSNSPPSLEAHGAPNRSPGSHLLTGLEAPFPPPPSPPRP